MLDPACFTVLDQLWGPHTVDHFASILTRQLPRYCSRYRNPGSEAADAFTVSWQGENNWLFPPPYLIPRILLHMAYGMEEGTLIIPEWPSARWWPLLVSHQNTWQPFVCDSRRILPYNGLFSPGVEASSIFAAGAPAFAVMALHLKFTLLVTNWVSSIGPLRGKAVLGQ